MPLGANSGATGFGIGGGTFGGRSIRGKLGRAMQTYSNGTGSGHLNATSNKAVADAEQKIGLELHRQYWISYKPTNLSAKTNVAEFHTIVVKAKVAGITVRHRPGYFYTAVQ